MFVIEKLRLNKFKPTPVVSGRRLFQLFGLSAPKLSSQQTAEHVEQVIPFGAKKTQALGLAEQIALRASEFKQDPEGTSPLQYAQPKDK